MALNDPTLFLPLSAIDLPSALSNKYGLPVELLQQLDSSKDHVDLITCQRWHALAESARQGIVNGQDTDQILARWTLRFHALYSLDAFQHLAQELDQLVARIQSTGIPESPAQWPYELRIYNALRPTWSGQREDAIERLTALALEARNLLRQELDDYDRQLWTARLERTKQLVEEEMLDLKAFASLEALQRVDRKRQARTLLYTGQLPLIDADSLDSASNAVVELAKGNFATASQALDELAAATSAPSPQLCNNLAVALMYEGKLNEAIGILEATLARHDKLWRDEHFLFNLCTMYELRTEKSATKKVDLLREAARRGSAKGIKLAL